MKFPNKRVMYLAPEVPALSATFVYNEILQFEKTVCPVEIVSVHRPASIAKEAENLLATRVLYLYGKPVSQLLRSLLRMFIRRPFKFFKACFAAAVDMVSVGSLSRTAAGVGFRFIYAASLAEEMDRRDVDHLHVHFAHVPADIAMYASMMTSIPFSLTGHANDIYERGWLLKQKAGRAKFFATISEFNKRALVSDQGCDQDKIAIVRCGIDQAEFKHQLPGLLESGVVRIGSLGRLVPKKGFQTLLEACAVLKDKSLKYVLEIAGDGPLMQDLKSQAESLGLNEQVKFLGALSHDEVPRWMKSLDVFALACCEDQNGDVDGIPVVLMEAMAIGVPVVTTGVSGLPELVIDQSTGLVSTQYDAAQLAECLQGLAADEKLRAGLSAKAAKHVESEFTIQANVEKLGQLIFSSSDGVV